MIFFKNSKIKRILKKLESYQNQRLHSQASSNSLKKEIALYHQLAKIYEELEGNKKFPFARDMKIECYRVAANIEDPEGQYLVAKNLLEIAKFKEKLQSEGIFASASNEQQIKQLYEEVHIYLKMAVASNNMKAKRLYGLCYIFGWGVPADTDRGFEFIVSSIEQEKSWDKVPQIFAAIGLNKPEFYTALMKHKNK